MFVKSIEFENLKAFDSLHFDFQRPDGRFAGWTVIVGGNASGKSTLLKGMALAMMGTDAGSRLLTDKKGWIRTGSNRAEAIVEVVVDASVDSFRRGGATAREFKAGVRWSIGAEGETPEFSPKEFRTPNDSRIKSPERGPWDPNASGWFSAGYGPMRRLSGSSTEATRYSAGGGVVSRYVSLFREDAALSESEAWLRQMHARTLETGRPDRDELKALVDGVVALLSDELLPHSMTISNLTVDQVYVSDTAGVELPMRDISDGCRGVYATILDIVHSMYEVYGASRLFARDANGGVEVQLPGVVLIDEIEAHLHPSWQRDIPIWLTKHFPNIQFIVSTHSPLIAQAADPNGIFVLPLQDEVGREPRRLSDAEYKKVRWGSAHKTVLGVAFGLSTTRSQWANDQIKQWQRLEAKRQAGADLSSEETRKYDTLKGQLKLAFDSDIELEQVTQA